jgi:hypothetical protein
MDLLKLAEAQRAMQEHGRLMDGESEFRVCSLTSWSEVSKTPRSRGQWDSGMYGGEVA